MRKANQNGGRSSGRRNSGGSPSSNPRARKSSGGTRRTDKDASKNERPFSARGKKPARPQDERGFRKSGSASGRSETKRTSESRNTGRFKNFRSDETDKRTGKRFGSDDETRSSGKRSVASRNEGRFKKFSTNEGLKPSRKRSGSSREDHSDDRKDGKPNKFGRRKSSEFSRGRETENNQSRTDRRGDRFSDTRRKTEKSGFFNKQRRGEKQSAEQESSAPVQTEKIRLNRYIANSGVCSRREADELISMGLISVNGTTITELGYKVNPGDQVRYEGKLLKAEKPVYILLNKPKGYLTTTDDPHDRNTVMHIVGNAVKERIYPVGRLDRNTTGLLLLTNDGDLADKLMHPSYNVKKIYKVELDRPLSRADFETILAGVKLEEGRAAVDDLAIVSDDGKTVGLEIHIGWNRVVRRIFESLEYQVIKLDRSVYAGLDKKDLGRGEWRHLSKEEIVRLKHYK